MSKYRKIFWLVLLITLLLSMISLGGITRLTKSGLSITEWRPITGTLPPLSSAAWQTEFDLYKKSPEYKQVNSHFELNDYKSIFWWEYLHRLLGRIIFLVALIISYLFWQHKEATKTYVILLPSLIIFQGFIGWLMVKTGLNHRPSVSHYMLALHYILALITLIVAYHPIAKLKTTLTKTLSSKSYKLLAILGVLLSFQILYGCFTSGLKAGLYHNTFPLMGGNLFPNFGLTMSPLMKNFVANPVTVQWLHRWLGISTALYVLYVSFYLVKNEGRTFYPPVIHLVSVVIIQIIIGILTLVLKVPLALAVSHQFMAAILILGYFNIVFRVQRSSKLR